MVNLLSESTVELHKTNASDEDVAYAAWVSNNADPRAKDTGRIEGLIGFLMRERHMSPFEHGSFTFIVKTPIFVAREFMRHRTFSYNELSGRYTELPQNFYMPTEDRPVRQTGKVGSYSFEPGTYDQYAAIRGMERTYQECWDKYQSMLNLGIAREVARNVLPVGIYTSFFATCNPRNLMQFLDLRLDPQAQYEIRQVAGQMETHFAETMPLTYRAWRDS